MSASEFARTAHRTRRTLVISMCCRVDNLSTAIRRGTSAVTNYHNLAPGWPLSSNVLQVRKFHWMPSLMKGHDMVTWFFTGQSKGVLSEEIWPLQAWNSIWGKHRASPTGRGRILHGGLHTHRLAQNLPIIPSWCQTAETLHPITSASRRSLSALERVFPRHLQCSGGGGVASVHMS